jgi:hypothetical protein
MVKAKWWMVEVVIIDYNSLGQAPCLSKLHHTRLEATVFTLHHFNIYHLIIAKYYYIKLYSGFQI